MSTSRKALLALITLAGVIFGGFLGVAGSMWGGIEVILPATIIVCGGLAYVIGRMMFAVIDAYR